MTPAISVIVVSWNVQEYLTQCLESVFAAARPHDEVIVVDNASADGSVHSVSERFPSVVLIRNDRNRHYSPAVNQGIAVARGELLLILNPDTLIPPWALEKAARTMGSRSDIGALGFPMLNPDGSLQSFGREWPGLMTTAVKWFLPHRVWKTIASITSRSRATRASASVVSVPALAGSAMCVRASEMRQLGGFAEDLPVYAEDLDLVGRLRAANWVIACLADTPIIHYEGRSFAQVSIESRIMGFLALHAFLARHGRAPRLVTLLLGVAAAARWLAWRTIPYLAPGLSARAARERSAYRQILSAAARQGS